ncbi:protein HEADING DATE 3B isoform X4 [Sesbania bispinosa]|nr:protein HEADING DATE 3B isoform X4 [Sesbania bispinosa]
MKAAIDEGKEISPMFPRLHIKDAEKGGPKAPPRNKMALYEQFSTPSQSSASGSTSLFSLPLRNCTVANTSSQVGSSQSIQFCISSAPSMLSEKIQAYNSRKINLTKLTQDDFINSKNSLKTLDGDAHGINQNNKDEDKLAPCNLSCSLQSLNSFRKKVSSPEAIELNSAQYGKNQMEEPAEVSQIGQKPKEGPPHPLDGLGDMAYTPLNSLVKGRNSKSMEKEHRSLKDEITSNPVVSLKTLQGRNAHTHQEHAAFGAKISLRDKCTEKPAASDVQRCPGELEIGRGYLLSKRGGTKDEETYRHYYALNKPSSECIFGMDISPDNVVGVIGEKQFWKARRTIINQQRIFLMQVFELHRLIKVQRLIAGSPHLLLEDNLVPNKPPLKTSTPKKLHSEFVSERPSTVVKLNSKSEKATTAENAKNNAVGKIPLPCVNNSTSKGHVNGNHFGNVAPASADTKQSPNCVYPPLGNQWLVPVMSPSEGLVYKPVFGLCPPNAGFMAPVYGTCGTMSFSPVSKDVLDASITQDSHQKIGILSGGSSLPQFLIQSASVVDQMGQSNGPENHHSSGEVNSAILYQSSSNISSHTSQVMSRNISTYHSLKEKESTASSPSKRMKGDALPLFPMAPTFWPSSDRSTQVENQPRVIKALPHNPKSATESAARIFRSIQEERKHL